VERLRTLHDQRIRRASSINVSDGGEAGRAQAAMCRLRHETLSAERRALIDLRDQGSSATKYYRRWSRPEPPARQGVRGPRPSAGPV